MASQSTLTDADFRAAHAPDLILKAETAPFRVAAILGFLGVGLGAFGAHGLKGFFESSELGAAAVLERTGWWETAAHYQLVHAVALLAAAGACAALGRRARAATWCFGLGVVIFSGTLYGMALGAPRWFGAITPVGGLLLMAGWIAVLLSCRPSR